MLLESASSATSSQGRKARKTSYASELWDCLQPLEVSTQ